MNLKKNFVLIGLTTCADLEIKGYSVFGSTSVEYPAIVVSTPGSIFIEKHLELGGTAYFWGGLGISTGAPQGLFEVGAGTFTVKRSGKVGIGTTNPGSKLEVTGDISVPANNKINVEGASGNTYIVFDSGSNQIKSNSMSMESV